MFLEHIIRSRETYLYANGGVRKQRRISQPSDLLLSLVQKHLGTGSITVVRIDPHLLLVIPHEAQRHDAPNVIAEVLTGSMFWGNCVMYETDDPIPDESDP